VYLYDAKTYIQQKVELKSLFFAVIPQILPVMAEADNCSKNIVFPQKDIIRTGVAFNDSSVYKKKSLPL